MADPITTHDGRSRYCSMLGHHLCFSYCRATTGNRPCGRVVDCWRETFDVEQFLRLHLTDEQMQQIGAPRSDKAATLVELIAKAKRAQSELP